MTSEEISRKLREIKKKGTKGPWQASSADEDANLITHGCVDIPRLLDEVERLREERNLLHMIFTHEDDKVNMGVWDEWHKGLTKDVKQA